jgi:hypothetical protein
VFFFYLLIYLYVNKKNIKKNIKKMKRIIRLTESDLARIVRRVIAEESQSTPNVSFKDLTFSIKDNQGYELYRGHSYGRESDISLKQTMFDQNEIVTIEIGGGLVGTNAIIKTDSGDKKLTVTNNPFKTTFNVSELTQNTKLQMEEIIITGANVDNGGMLILRLNFSDSTIQPAPTNESYRRRYRRY